MTAGTQHSATRSASAPTAGTSVSPRTRSVWSRRINGVALSLAPIAVLILVWQLWVTANGGDSLFIVSPLTAARQAWVLIANGQLLDNMMASLERVLIGVSIGAAVAIPLGIAIGWIPAAERTLKPIVELLRPVPIPAWVPLFILLFGIGQRPAVLLIALASFIPIVVNTWDAVRYTNPVHVRVAEMLGASPLQVLRFVVFPSSLPGIVTGLRLGLGIGVMAVVLAELMAVRSGLGYMIQVAQVEFDMPTILVGIASTAVLGFSLGAILNAIVRKAMPWRHR